LRQTLGSSFVRTASDIVANGRPFTEVVTTRTWSVSTAELVLLAFADLTEAELAVPFKIRFKTGAAPSLTKVADVWEIGGILPAGQVCKVSQGPGAATEVQDMTPSRFLGMLFGRIPCFGSTFGDLRFAAFVGQAEHADARTVTFSKGPRPQIPFHDVARLRALPAGATLALRLPRAGFATTPVFLDNWQTNADNQFRVSLNQTLAVALGATFSMGDPTPSPGFGVDEAHAPSSSACFDCHRLMDPMRPFFGNAFDTSYRARAATSSTNAGSSPAWQRRTRRRW
jgi:hypothetical protein